MYGDDVNQTYCGDYFVTYTNIKSLYYTPETNTVLYVNYTSIKNISKRNPEIYKKNNIP